MNSPVLVVEPLQDPQLPLLQRLQHLQQLQHPHQQRAVDLLNGLPTNGVMMKTTTPNAIGMVEPVVTMVLEDGLVIVQHANALIQMLEPQQPLLLLAKIILTQADVTD